MLGLRVLTGTGESLDAPAIRDGLRGVARAGLATIRTEFGRFGRQVSGYALENLLPEKGFDVTRLLVGSEGTLAVATEATVRLVAEPAHRLLVVLGYPDIAAAGDATPRVLAHHPVACEGIDSRIVDVVRERLGPQAVPPLPRGAAWLFVEVTGDDPADTVARAETLGNDCDALESLVVTDSGQSAALWRIRADGAGLSSRSPAGLPAHAGWEDAAVPPAMLGDYLRDFDALMAEYGFTGLPYGHFGDGCLHIRIDFPLDKPGGARVFREFLVAAARIGRRLRRLTVGGARRRPGPRRTTADDVLRRRAEVVRGGQERVRPAEHPQPGGDRRPAAARRGPSRAARPGLAAGPGAGLPRRPRRLHARRCTAAPGSVSAVPTTPRPAA